MTIILAMMFGTTVGLGIMAGFNNHSYNQGYKEGKGDGFLDGREYGRNEASEYYDDILETIDNERGR